MHKLKILLLCAVIFLPGCSLNLKPNAMYGQEQTPGYTPSATPSSAPSETPYYKTDINITNETAEANSNIDNGGIAVFDGQQIYIATDKLYRMDMYCRQSTVLLDSPDVCFLNVYNDYLYFVNATDYGVYRMNKDGQDLRKLPVTGAFNLVVADDSLFYQYSVSENADNMLYKCDLWGTNIECLNITAGNLCAGETGLFFSNKDDNGYLYKYSYNEKAIVKVRSDSVKQINIISGSIYYIAANEDNKIITINSTGSGRKVIVNESCKYLNHVGSRLVFSTDLLGGIETISTDGTGRTLILEVSDVHALNIAGDYIFFESFPLPCMDAITYRIRLDGTGLNPEFPEQSLAILKDFDTEAMLLELDYVEYLTGEEAVDAYSYDKGLSEKKARSIVETELNGTYLWNKSPKLREYKLTNYSSITLLTRSDGSLAMEGYSANTDDFAALYQSNSEIYENLLYLVTASGGEIISIEQKYISAN